MAGVYNLELLKDFIHQLAYGIEGKYDDKMAVFAKYRNKSTKQKQNHIRKNHFIHLGSRLYKYLKCVSQANSRTGLYCRVAKDIKGITDTPKKWRVATIQELSMRSMKGYQLDLDAVLAIPAPPQDEINVLE
ncbi:hypothetical protein DPV78_009830 [Talaromyces pinophilus]|nr:hypothetical protein DPV78_009830 [Talaromyces pinophilus]